MFPKSQLLQSMLAGTTALGLALSGACSPLWMADCAFASEVITAKAHCCCGENCHCGPSCCEKPQGNGDRQGTTSVDRDLRDLGKISSATIRLAHDVTRGHYLIDSESSVASADWPHSLLAQHTLLQV